MRLYEDRIDRECWSKLRNYPSAPPYGLWDNIAEELDRQERRQARFRFLQQPWAMRAAASLIFLLGIGATLIGYFYGPGGEPTAAKSAAVSQYDGQEQQESAHPDSGQHQQRRNPAQDPQKYSPQPGYSGGSGFAFGMMPQRNKTDEQSSPKPTRNAQKPANSRPQLQRAAPSAEAASSGQPAYRFDEPDPSGSDFADKARPGPAQDPDRQHRRYDVKPERKPSNLVRQASQNAREANSPMAEWLDQRLSRLGDMVHFTPYGNQRSETAAAQGMPIQQLLRKAEHNVSGLNATQKRRIERVLEAAGKDFRERYARPVQLRQQQSPNRKHWRFEVKPLDFEVEHSSAR
jgi:hypothetical protein